MTSHKYRMPGFSRAAYSCQALQANADPGVGKQLCLPALKKGADPRVAPDLCAGLLCKPGRFPQFRRNCHD